jgi:hypothetical protein
MECCYTSEEDSAYETGKEEEKEVEQELVPEGGKEEGTKGNFRVKYRGMAEDALPFKEELQQLLEVKHAGAFAKTKRDYCRTSLIQYHANLRDKNVTPIALPPYRTRPEHREAVDKQSFEMLADGLVSPSTSPYSAPILLCRKKLGGWRFVTDFFCLNTQCE